MDVPVELRQLRYFVAVAEELHFGHAAERLHMAQSPLSRAIRELERELGVVLFTRTTRRVELTPAGVVLLEGARRALAEVDAAIDDTRHAAEPNRGVLSLGHGPLSDRAATSIIEEFAAQHPGMQIRDEEDVTPELLARVAARELAAAVVVETPAAARRHRVRVDALRDEPLLAALPTAHRYAREGAIPIGAFAAERVVLPREPGGGAYNAWLRSVHQSRGVRARPHAGDRERGVGSQALAGRSRRGRRRDRVRLGGGLDPRRGRCALRAGAHVAYRSRLVAVAVAVRPGGAACPDGLPAQRRRRLADPQAGANRAPRRLGRRESRSGRPRVFLFLRRRRSVAGVNERGGVAVETTRTDRDRIPLMMIHGAWLAANSWENFAKYFENRGFSVSAPEWPRKRGDVEELREDAEELKGLGMTEIVDHYEEQIRALDEPPVLIGHSFGGLIVELLLDRGLGRAGVAMSPAPPKGILVLPFSSLKAAAPALAHPSKRNGIVTLTLEEFTYGFVNTFSPEDAAAAYERYAVPETGRIFYEAGLANFHFNPPTEVHFKNSDRAPLLIVGADEDHTVPASVSRKQYEKYERSPAMTEYVEFEGRPHLLMAAEGWEEVAASIDSWLDGVLDVAAVPARGASA